MISPSGGMACSSIERPRETFVSDVQRLLRTSGEIILLGEMDSPIIAISLPFSVPGVR